MVKIAAIGWYGTETIGDRAIFAGLLSLLSKTFGDFEISLGSLYPFYTERMLFEDQEIYSRMLGKGLKISLFNSKKTSEIDRAIARSDLVVMAGGPLMHIKPLHMVDYAFKKAKKLKKKTAILGCGVGPIFQEKFHKVLISIVMNSDCIVLRDQKSSETLRHIAYSMKFHIDDIKVHIAADPAIVCAHEFSKREYPVFKQQEFIAINYRSFPQEYVSTSLKRDINNEILLFTENLSVFFAKTQILLVPMHYFHVGTDDRSFLNDLSIKLNKNNILVQNKPLTLSETMETFSNAAFNIGMRFHSVLLQTVLSGRNIALDYTEPSKGKIYGFLKMIGHNDFFNERRYINLQESPPSFDAFAWDSIKKPYKLSESTITKVFETYGQALKWL